MSYSRRDFMKVMGVALAALVTTRCVALENIQHSISNWTSSGSGRERLRNCWLDLKKLYELDSQILSSEGHGYAECVQLISNHRTTLQDLTKAGELKQDVANEIDVAFTAAADYIWWLRARMYLYGVCYTQAPTAIFTPLPDSVVADRMASYVRVSAGQLFNQSIILAKMAPTSDINSDTVAEAQAAIERDVEFINKVNDEAGASSLADAVYGNPLPNDAAWKLFRQLHGADADPNGDINFETAQFDISPQASEAAHFLVTLLTETE